MRSVVPHAPLIDWRRFPSNSYSYRMANDSELEFLDISKYVDGPFVATYTAHLPFPVGIPSELGHLLFLDIPFKNADAAEYFGNRPFVNIRVFDTVERGLPVWQKGTHAAIKQFYGVELPGNPDLKYGEDQFAVHDQWVTLETPHAALEGEDSTADRAFSFHRCLRVFNLFLQTTNNNSDYWTIYPVL
jgi:hypothetical protein